MKIRTFLEIHMLSVSTILKVYDGLCSHFNDKPKEFWRRIP